MSAIFLCVFIFVFLIIIEILCILFKLTGLTDEKARFQVISLLTSTGFTTKESELITQHKTRRKLAQYVMILGYVGLATIISFMANIISDIVRRNFSVYDIVTIVVLLTITFFILKDKRILIYLDNFIEKVILKRRIKRENHKNIYTLLSRKHGYGIYNIFIEDESNLVGRSILESSLKAYEIQVLNIDKGDEFIAFPTAQYVFESGDNLLIYGKVENIIRVCKLSKN